MLCHPDSVDDVAYSSFSVALLWKLLKHSLDKLGAIVFCRQNILRFFFYHIKDKDGMRLNGKALFNIRRFSTKRGIRNELCYTIVYKTLFSG